MAKLMSDLEVGYYITVNVSVSFCHPQIIKGILLYTFKDSLWNLTAVLNLQPAGVGLWEHGYRLLDSEAQALCARSSWAHRMLVKNIA